MARPKGSKNKNLSGKDFKDQLEYAFNKVNRKGAYLLMLAEKEPKAFAGLLSKLMPSAIDLGHALIDANDRLKAMTSMHNITPTTVLIDNDTQKDNELEPIHIIDNSELEPSLE